MEYIAEEDGDRSLKKLQMLVIWFLEHRPSQNLHPNMRSVSLELHTKREQYVAFAFSQ